MAATVGDSHTISGAPPGSLSPANAGTIALPVGAGSGSSHTTSTADLPAASRTQAGAAQEGQTAGSRAISDGGGKAGCDSKTSSDGSGVGGSDGRAGFESGSRVGSDGGGKVGSDGGATASSGGYLGWVPGVYGNAVSRLTDYSNLSSAAVSMLTDSSAWSKLTSLSGQALGGGGSSRSSTTNLAGQAENFASASQRRRQVRVKGDAGVAGGGWKQGSDGGDDDSGSEDDSFLADMAEVLIGRPVGDTTTATQLQPTMPELPQQPAPTLLDLMASDGPLSSIPFLPSTGDDRPLKVQPTVQEFSASGPGSSCGLTAAHQRAGYTSQPGGNNSATQQPAAALSLQDSDYGKLVSGAGEGQREPDVAAASPSYGHTIRLIVEPAPTASDKQLWDQQRGMCPGCRAALPAVEMAGPLVWGSKARHGPRRCSYTGGAALQEV